MPRTTTLLRATALLLAAAAALTGASAAAQEKPAARPNILWISSEDHGPHMGCYGDRFATTPNVDALAAKGTVYLRVWSCAPVCAPARTAIISGLYPPATGADHMRSLVAYPRDKKMFPQYLREAGYYCTNNVKEDYNLEKPGQVWDDSSKKAHWKNRAEGQPFFAVFNSTKSHESQIRTRPHQKRHDPAGVRVPAHHPDAPESREDWAQYYDRVSEADADAGARLKELDDAGLSDDTIVFYFADHGAGLPRHKRTPTDSGLHAPLVVHIPPKWRSLASSDYREGGSSKRLVNFLDFAPTVLSLAGVRPPDWLHGRAFLGPFATEAPAYSFGFRGRMDERHDFVRSVTDGRYVYVRNYLPHLPYGQHVEYMFETPTTVAWKRLFDEGKLDPAQARFWGPKPPEELYDLEADPDEVRDLAGDPEHAETLARLRAAQQDFARRTRDLGFLPEGERFTRSPGTAPYDFASRDEVYPFERVFAAAELASRFEPAAVPELKKLLADDDSAVRYWAAMGLLMRREKAVADATPELRAALDDASPHVRVAAAHALVAFGESADAERGLNQLVERADWGKNDAFVVLAALNALDHLGEKAGSKHAAIVALPTKGPVPDERYSPDVPKLMRKLKSAGE